MSDETPLDNQEDQSNNNLSRLNSLTERVSDVTDRTKKYLMNQKTPTPATKKTLDGVLIDRRLTHKTGVLHKAKMIGSLSVKFHKGDKMAIDAMRDLQVMAKSSERHKARILLRISVNGIHILEAGTMKQIDMHDIDKISYLAEDPDNKRVFCYIYNKQLLNKETGKSTTIHRLYAIKSPKAEVIVAHMKGVFHYMYDMRMAESKPSSSNVDMAAAKKEVEEGKERPKSDDENDPLGFNYGKLVELGEPEELIKPVVTSEGEAVPGTSGGEAAGNIYVTAPGSNKIEAYEVEEEEAVYSTVRKIREDDVTTPPPKPQRPPRIEVTTDRGTVNPSWDKSQAHSLDEDVFSLDRYKKLSTSSSSSSEEEHTFGVIAGSSPTPIPSAVYDDSQDYEWDISAKRYSEGHLELSESRERLSTLTKQAVASLERVREERKGSLPPPPPADSLIDFATFEDRMETSDALELFDTLTEKPASSTAPSNSRAGGGNDLFDIDFTSAAPTDAGQQATVQASAETEKYNIDISTLISDPNTYKNPAPGPMMNPSWVSFQGGSGGQPPMGMNPQMGGLPPPPPSMLMMGGSMSGPPTQNFPFGRPQEPPAKPASNPFTNPRSTTASNTATFDPFSDLVNDAI